MIPFLIFILSKKYGNQRLAEIVLKTRNFFSPCLYIIFVSLLTIFLLLIPILSKTQALRLNYKIMKGGDDIGWLQLQKNVAENKSNLVLVSEIKTRVIFFITVFAKESAIFENGKMIYSSQFRKTNSNKNLDKQTRLVGKKYEVFENGEKELLTIPLIRTNLLSLYFNEPLDIKFVYSEKYECFIKILKTDDGGYKVKFPDGNSNCYYYKGGQCTKIKIIHTFYNAEVILTP